MTKIRNMLLRRLLFSFIFLLFVLILPAQETINSIAQSIQTGNTKELSKYFNKRLDVTINQNGNNYSNDQAELIIKDFLNSVPNREFTVMQKGNTEYNTEYIIGVLKSKNAKYKTYILLKPYQKSLYIHDIRFEKE